MEESDCGIKPEMSEGCRWGREGVVHVRNKARKHTWKWEAELDVGGSLNHLMHTPVVDG